MRHKRRRKSCPVKKPIQGKMRQLSCLENRGKMQERQNKSEGRRKDKTTQSDLYQALFPIYHIAKLCGLFPVRFVKQGVGRYRGRLSVFDVIYSFCLLVVLVVAEFWGFWRDVRDGWEESTRLKSPTAVIATCSDVFGVMCLTIVSIAGSTFRWKYIQPVIERLVEADEKLGIVAPAKTRRFTIRLTCNLVYLLITSILDVYAWNHEISLGKKMSDKGPLNYVPIYFMYAVIILMEVQYAVCAYNVGQRFLRLNKALEMILKRDRITDYFRKDLGLAGDLREKRIIVPQQYDETESRLFRTKGTATAAATKTMIQWYPAFDEKRSYAENMSELVAVHSSLCDTVTFINSAFGVALLVVTLTCLLHLIITPYFLILEADGRRESIFLLVQAMWCIFHTARMLIIIQPTYSTVTEGKKTAVLVSQLLCSVSDVEVKKQLEIFSLQLLHRPLEFSACGLFSLDRALVTSIAGAVTTYLVILIQFQKADDTKGDADVIRNVSQILKNASTIQNLTALKLPS